MSPPPCLPTLLLICISISEECCPLPKFYTVWEALISYLRKSSLFWISVFISSTKLEFEIKELLNFQRPRSLEILLKFRKEQNNREWSVDRTSSSLAFLVNSCILFEINKSSSLLYKIPVKWRCWNVLDLGFLICHVSHKLGDSF